MVGPHVPDAAIIQPKRYMCSQSPGREGCLAKLWHRLGVGRGGFTRQILIFRLSEKAAKCLLSHSTVLAGSHSGMKE